MVAGAPVCGEARSRQRISRESKAMAAMQNVVASISRMIGCKAARAAILAPPARYWAMPTHRSSNLTVEKPAQPSAAPLAVQSRLRTGPGLPFFGPHSRTAT